MQESLTQNIADNAYTILSREKVGVKPVQEEKFVEIPTPTFFPVFTGNLREKRNFLRFLQISPLVQSLP